MVSVSCNLCKSQDCVEVYKSNGLRAVMCKNCSLVYLNPRWTEAEYDKFYAESYQKSRHGLDNFDQAVARLLHKKSYEKKYKSADIFSGILDKGKSVLEIGSGWGTTLKVLSDRFGCLAMGVEISELAAKVSREFYNLNVENTTFAQYLSKSENKNKKFDLVIMHHVLEHFLDPLAGVIEIKKLLNPGGLVYIAVPNINKPEDPLDRFFHVEHCYYFNDYTLGRLLNLAGFSTLKKPGKYLDLKMFGVLSAKIQPQKYSNISKFSSKFKIKFAILRQRVVYDILRFLGKIIDKYISKNKKERIISFLRKIKIIRV